MTQSFEVREINSSGVVETTTYAGETEEDVIRIVRNKGHLPIKVSPIETKNASQMNISLFQPKVKIKDLAMLCKQMSAMLYAGMPLLETLDVIKVQTSHARLAIIIGEVAEQVEKGDMFSAALKRYPKEFPPIMPNMVAAGEMTGRLDAVLEKLALHFSKEHKINQKVKGAMIYPAVIGVVTIIAVAILLVYVMPTFVGMFEGSGVELPLITKLLLALSDFLINYWYAILLGLVLLIYGMSRFFATERGKYIFDSAVLKLPIIKTSATRIIMSRFTSTLATLLSSGIPLLDALTSAAKVTNNSILIKEIDKIADDIKKGKWLSELLQSIEMFPKMLVSMIKVGEESGSIEGMLNRSAQFYEEELEEAIKRLTSLIEPVMILLMALIVGTVVVAIITPMFKIYETIQ